MMGYGYGSGDQRVNAFMQPYGAEARGAQAPATSMQPLARPASFATATPIQSTMPAQVPMPVFQPPVPVQTSYLDPQFDLERILAGLNRMQDPRMVGYR